MLMKYEAETDHAVLRSCPEYEYFGAEQQTSLETFVSKIRAVEQAGVQLEVSTRAFIEFTRNWFSHDYQVARAMLLARFDDEGVRSAIRTVMREIWTNEGEVRPQAGGA